MRSMLLRKAGLLVDVPRSDGHVCLTELVGFLLKFDGRFELLRWNAKMDF